MSALTWMVGLKQQTSSRIL
uniref:Uncharacterized protein n=1 Tax=Arundo donax TaxID=35708 RepID=A0A0A9GJE5_ARUDO